MKTAQRHLDDALGGGRLPDHSDIDNLPYITAIVKETLRWAPPLPAGLAHRLMEDDVYREMLIPGGAVILENIWWGCYCVLAHHRSSSLFQGHMLRRIRVSGTTHLQPGSIPRQSREDRSVREGPRSQDLWLGTQV